MTLYYKIETENDENNLKNYLKEHSEKTKRNVVVYASNFLTNDEDEVYIDCFDKIGFVKVIENLDKSKGLDLILHTPGGSISDTESIIEYLHSVFKGDIRAIIPQMAMSGGTLIACSCKEIIMGKQSSLGPVDPQILDVSAKNVIKEYELAKKEISKQPEVLPFWSILLDKYPANFMFECKNSIEWTNEILDNALKNSMFNEKENSKKIDRIKCALITGNTTKDHTQNLSVNKCKEIGLNIKNLEDNRTMQNLILSIHYSYLNYFTLKKASKIFVNQKGMILSTYTDK